MQKTSQFLSVQVDVKKYIQFEDKIAPAI